MQKDQSNFKFPIIDEEKCIGCTLCVQKCGFTNEKSNVDEKECYALYSNDKNILLNSASGGVFTSIAKRIIEDGGVVCGAAFTRKNSRIFVEHIIVDKEEDLTKIQGSKYVQSDLTDVLDELEKYLKSGIKVLFSGTPCPVSSIKKVYGKKYENLYTIDIICHGVPNIDLLQDYVEYIEKKKNIKIEKIKFRDKKNGWMLNGTIDATKKGKKLKIIFSNKTSSYYYFFQNGYFYRDSCYNCCFANDHRVGDITIGDYWGVDIEHPEIKSNEGVSCLIINSNKGKKLFDENEKYLTYFKTKFKKIQRNNSQLNFPTKKPDDMDYIFNKYLKDGYSVIEKKFVVKVGIIQLIKQKIKYWLKNRM